MKKFKALSRWGQNHPVKTRLIIALATVLSIALHYYYGLYLYAIDVLIPFQWAAIIMFIGLTGVFFYPFKRNKRGIFAHTYLRQKGLDFTIFFCGGLLVIYAANQRAAKVDTDPSLSHLIMEAPQAVETSASVIHLVSLDGQTSGKKPSSTSLSRKEIRKKLKAQLKIYKQVIKNEIRAIKQRRKKGERGTGEKVALTLLVIIGALGLGLLVAALSCSIICNGNGTLGLVVLIVGWGGILVLSILAIREIFSREGRRRERPPRPTENEYPY